MPNRIQVQDLYKDRGYLPEIQGTASPVDTYVNPGKPVIKDIRLLEFAAAWQDVEPGLSQFAQQRIEKVNQDQVEEGKKAALANKAQFKQAIDQGLIPAGASPWFQMGYERQRATRTAIEYDQAMREAYAQTDLAASDDPEAISKWMAEFTSGWLEKNEDAKTNPEFGRVFSVLGAQTQNEVQSLHAAERTKRIEATLIEDTDFRLGATLDKGIDLLGNRSPDLGQTLAQIVGEQVPNGLPGPMANRLVTDAVIRKAVEEKDITLLDLLQEVPSGSGTVGQIGWVKDKVAQARDQITQEVAERDRRSELTTKQKRVEVMNSLRSSAYQKIANDPNADVSEEFRLLNMLDPDEAAKVESFRTAFIGSLSARNKVIESPLVKTDMTIRALKGELDERGVEAAVMSGEIDAETARDLLVNLMPKAKEQKSLLNSPVVTRFEKNIRDVITKNEFADEFADQRAFRAAEANSFFLTGMLNYRQSHPDATDVEMIRYAKDLQQEALELFREESAEPLPALSLDNKDPKRDALFPDAAALNKAIQEINTTKGQSGKLKALADQYQMDLVSLVNAQRKLFTPQNPPGK